MPGKRGKQSVKKGIWYIGGKRKTRKRQRGKGFLNLFSQNGKESAEKTAPYKH